MKFKIGDRVKILPSAVGGGVSELDVGKTGVVTQDSSQHAYFLVKMDELSGNNAERNVWAVYSCQATSAIRKGQQLLLWEDMYI